MRIGYDAKRAFLNRTGLGNYSRWLIRSLAYYYPRNTFYLYTPKIKPGNAINSPEDLTNVVAVVPGFKFLTSWWRSIGIVKALKRDHIELYHGLSHELPYGIEKTGIKTVVTVHDLIFMRFPHYFGFINRVIYGSKLKHACKVADKIIAISEQTKKDLVELLDIPTNKIEVIYQGCDPAFKVACTDEAKQTISKKYFLPTDFILNIGTIEERKNLILLVNALPALKTPIKLVVIGRQTEYAKKVKQITDHLKLNDRVIFLDSVSYTDLPAMYQLAKVFVYPSRYEGFGIPVLEALCSGTPVIAASGSCLEEAGGPNSLYVGPNDVDALSDKLNLVLADESLRQQMINKGKEYSGNFDDRKLAAKIFALYENIFKHA